MSSTENTAGVPSVSGLPDHAAAVAILAGFVVTVGLVVATGAVAVYLLAALIVGFVAFAARVVPGSSVEGPGNLVFALYFPAVWLGIVVL